MNLDLTINEAQTLAQQHYENFPVAPWFLPKNLREPIVLIYAFARMADDIADEGNDTSSVRVQKLQSMHQQLPDRATSQVSPFFKQLNKMISERKLPCQLFHDLLDAFEQDCVKSRYDNFDQVMDYCKRSANPIGRLLLHLSHHDSPANLKLSDQICSGLQLINFAQDWHQDLLQRDRVYIPLEDLKQFNTSIEALTKGEYSQNLKMLLDLQWQRAHDVFMQGVSLGERLPGRFGFKIRLTQFGGWTILKKLKNRQNLTHRPILKGLDWISLAFYALCKKRPQKLG